MKKSNPTDSPLVISNRDQLSVDTTTIAQLFGRPHKNVLRSLASLVETGAISQLTIEPRDYIDSRGKTQPCYRLSERDALVLMPFIGGKRSMEGQAKLVDAFLNQHKVLLRLAKQKADPLRLLEHQDKCAASRLMCDALQQARAAAGKSTESHHYRTEGLLCNWVLTGTFSPIADSALNITALRELKKIRCRNTALILSGTPYAQRKTLLRESFPLEVVIG
ncbi:Phage regulatory protein Rha (Phage-pRha) [Pseudomonas sp. GM21]|jgi:Rha family phage regulatory protein|uniref:Rha family transcriptional regulator n=1 Tax=Pseudomonas sp. GM21 TaxID=1144325 RepID=UPI0002727A48|nr:Rha family transcriptional regulator [Pseudomonas sp. GM21]EJM22462.1 Phage regulatory protein Rha (Phage-pRha) [Pseudomonas sp. GM21]